MSKWLLLIGNSEILQQSRGEKRSRFDEMTIMSVLNKPACCDFNSISSWQQQSTDILVAPLGHILILSLKPTVLCYYSLSLLSREIADATLIVFCFTRPWIEPIIYYIRCERAYHYIAENTGVHYQTHL